MSHVYEDKVNYVVRRKGTTDHVSYYFGVGGGDRRSRQIAERHWVLKRQTYSDSHGGHCDTATVKPAGKGEVFCKKPGVGGGLRVQVQIGDPEEVMG